MTGREQVTVNGVDRKVDRLEVKLDAFIERAEPMMEFYSAGTSLLNWLKWILGLGASAAAIVLAANAIGLLKS